MSTTFAVIRLANSPTVLVAVLATACGLSGIAESEFEEPDEEWAHEPPRKGNARAIIALAQTQPKAEPEPVEGCPADLAVTPAALLQESVLVRPPKGVEFSPDEGNPVFAQAIANGGFVSVCDTTVRRVVFLAIDHDPTKTLSEATDEFASTLATQGYVDGTSEVTYDDHREHHRHFEFPAAGRSPAVALYVAMLQRKRDGDAVTYVLVYEALPDDYRRLEPTFQASSNSLLVVPTAVSPHP